MTKILFTEALLARTKEQLSYIDPRKPMTALELVNIIAPEHDRTSCDDNHINNGWASYTPSTGRTSPRCVRCALLEIVYDGTANIPDDYHLSMMF